MMVLDECSGRRFWTTVLDLDDGSSRWFAPTSLNGSMRSMVLNERCNDPSGG
jgi:hypothetical protein